MQRVHRSVRLRVRLRSPHPTWRRGCTPALADPTEPNGGTTAAADARSGVSTHPEHLCVFFFFQSLCEG